MKRLRKSPVGTRHASTLPKTCGETRHKRERKRQSVVGNKKKKGNIIITL